MSESKGGAYLAQVVTPDLAVSAISTHVADFQGNSVSDLQVRLCAFRDFGDGTTAKKADVSVRCDCCRSSGVGLPCLVTENQRVLNLEVAICSVVVVVD
jgi:hypothetical protein